MRNPNYKNLASNAEAIQSSEQSFIDRCSD